MRGIEEEKIRKKRRKRSVWEENSIIYNILIEYKYVYPSTDKYRMNIGMRIEWKREGR